MILELLKMFAVSISLFLPFDSFKISVSDFNNNQEIIKIKRYF